MGYKDVKGNLLPLSEWKVFNCHRHFSKVMIILFFGKINFLNRFLVMNGIWSYPSHWFNAVKQFYYLFSNDLCLRDINDDLKTWGKTERVQSGHNHKSLYAAYLLLAVEFGISLKYNVKNYAISNEPLRYDLISLWVIFYLLSYLFWIYLRFFKNESEEYPRFILSTFPTDLTNNKEYLEELCNQTIV